MDTYEDSQLDTVEDTLEDPIVDEVEEEITCSDDGDSNSYIDILCGGDDCDDTDPTIHPGGTIDCSAIDHDCNGYPPKRCS